MKKIIIGFALAALVGCVPGEATIKISAANVRRVLKGEVVEVPVHGEVKMAIPIEEWMKEQKCPVCLGPKGSLTNFVSAMNQRACAATAVWTLLLADGSCVTGGVKVVGTNVVYWANVDTKFLFGIEEAMLSASNRVNQCSGFLVLNDKGEVDLMGGKCKDMPQERFERIARVSKIISQGCRSCAEVYCELEPIFGVKEYDAVSLVFEGDGRGGFNVETGDKCVAADKIDKELRYVIRSKDSGEKDKPDNKVKLKRE